MIKIIFSEKLYTELSLKKCCTYVTSKSYAGSIICFDSDISEEKLGICFGSYLFPLEKIPFYFCYNTINNIYFANVILYDFKGTYHTYIYIYQI